MREMLIADIPSRSLAWNRYLELKSERNKTRRLLDKGRIEVEALKAVRARDMKKGTW